MAKKYLYKAGNEYTDFTGCWTTGLTSGGTVTKKLNAINYVGTNKYASIVTKKKIPVYDYLKIRAKVVVNSISGSPIVDMRIVNNADGDSDYVAILKTTISTTGEMILEGDVSNLNGDYYVSLQPNSTATSTTAIDIDFIEIWLEDGKADRKFQPGIIGKTNVVEGAVIPVPLRIPENTKFLLHFDENIDDAIGQRTATVATGSVSYAEGIFGQGVTFNGSSMLTIPLTDDLKLGSNDFTIAFWAKWNGNISSYAGILHQTRYYNSSYPCVGFNLWRTDSSDKRILLQLWSSYNTKLAEFASSSAIELSKWYHVAVVRDGNTVKLFVNGVLEGSSTVSGSIYCGSDWGWTIGGRYNTSNTTYTDLAKVTVDELIFVNGTALWTEDFELPTRAYR